jgi:hypothetical protein
MWTAGWSPYLGWLGSSTQMGRDSPINDAASVKHDLDLLGAALVKRSLDLLGVALRQRSVDEKELQHRRSGNEKELRPRSAPTLTSFP